MIRRERERERGSGSGSRLESIQSVSIETITTSDQLSTPSVAPAIYSSINGTCLRFSARMRAPSAATAVDFSGCSARFATAARDQCIATSSPWNSSLSSAPSATSSA